jgi:hypothetical protein
MSYDIVKSIAIKNGEVWITSHCNNVTPHIPRRWHCEPLTKIYAKFGKEGVEREILCDFLNGHFQGLATVYGKIAMLFPENSYEKLMEYRREANTKWVLKAESGYFVAKTTAKKATVLPLAYAKKYPLIDALMIQKRFNMQFALHPAN